MKGRDRVLEGRVDKVLREDGKKKGGRRKDYLSCCF